jgi:hypothetical protein
MVEEAVAIRQMRIISRRINFQIFSQAPGDKKDPSAPKDKMSPV